jgi:hypothetical protein
MSVKAIGGYTSRDVIAVPDNTESFVFQANGAIPVGSTVVLDLLGVTTGQATADNVLVVVGGADMDSRFVGVYSGDGGTGADDGTFGGKACVAGDQIRVITYGACWARVTGTIDISGAEGAAALALGATGAFIVATAESADGFKPIANVLADNSGTGTRNRVFLH